MCGLTYSNFQLAMFGYVLFLIIPILKNIATILMFDFTSLHPTYYYLFLFTNYRRRDYDAQDWGLGKEGDGKVAITN